MMICHAPTPPEVPLPLLITGVAGVPGYNAMAYFAAQYPGQVIGIRQCAQGYEIDIEEAGRTSTITSEIVINAAGLGSDLVAQMAGIDIDKEDLRLSYAKGSYFSIIQSKATLISRLVAMDLAGTAKL